MTKRRFFLISSMGLAALLARNPFEGLTTSYERLSKVPGSPIVLPT